MAVSPVIKVSGDFPAEAQAVYLQWINPQSLHGWLMPDLANRIDLGERSPGVSILFTLQPADANDIETKGSAHFGLAPNGSRLTISQEPMRDEADRTRYRQAWTQSFDNLVKLLLGEF